jgi:predicted amidohydrolase
VELSTTAARSEWLRSILPEAASKQTDLLLLPELFATRYHIGDQIAARTEPIDGPTAQTIANPAQAHNIAIHYGFAETDGQNTFNAAQCFGPNGIALGRAPQTGHPPRI